MVGGGKEDWGGWGHTEARGEEGFHDVAVEGFVGVELGVSAFEGLWGGWLAGLLSVRPRRNGVKESRVGRGEEGEQKRAQLTSSAAHWLQTTSSGSFLSSSRNFGAMTIVLDSFTPPSKLAGGPQHPCTGSKHLRLTVVI